MKNIYNFKFPELYETLLEDGMMDYTASSYLLDYKFFGADLEPFSYQEALQNYEEFPFWDKDKTKQIFPFAQTGAGDWYGFCFSMKTEHLLPIVLLFHDSDNALLLSDNLGDFIFYKMLMISHKIDDQCNDKTFKNELQRVLATHRKYLKQEHAEILEKVYSNEISNLVNTAERDQNKISGILSRREAEEIFVRSTGFAKLNEEIYCGT